MTQERTNGPAAAAILAAGIGIFVLGFFTVFAAANEALRSNLIWYGPAGPLSGKSGLGVIAWLASWPILHLIWRNRTVNFNLILVLSLILIALGLLFTFPPVFEAFEA